MLFAKNLEPDKLGDNGSTPTQLKFQSYNRQHLALKILGED